MKKNTKNKSVVIFYKDMDISLILKHFPEFQDKIDEEIQFWENDKIPPHCLFGDVFSPYLKTLLMAYEDVAFIERIFEFYEFLAIYGDEEVKNLLQVTLLEYLWDDHLVYKRAHKHMRPNTLKINSAISSYLIEPKWWL